MEESLTIYQIAEFFKCSPALISKKLKSYTIPTWRNPVNIPKDKIESLYNNNGLSVAKIAKYFNCGKTTVLSKMHALGITSRKKIILLSKEALEELYHKQKLEQKQIANLLGCDQATISNKMKEAKIKARDKSEISTKYPKYDFSNDLTEKAYLIGFRLGDLHVRKHRNLLSVACTTTRPEQMELIKGLFEKYTHVSIRTNKQGIIKINCLLNNSFLFLLEKQDNIPIWILENDDLFFAFLAGYTDAEGCIGIYQNKKKQISIMFILRTYDKNILQQIQGKLIELSIICPKAYLCTLKGAQNNNKDFWKLGVYRKPSLIKLFNLFGPYCKHPRIISGIKRATEIIK